MRMRKLKKLLQHYLTTNPHLQDKYSSSKFIEKSDYVNAIIQLESIVNAPNPNTNDYEINDEKFSNHYTDNDNSAVDHASNDYSTITQNPIWYLLAAEMMQDSNLSEKSDDLLEQLMQKTVPECYCGVAMIKLPRSLNVAAEYQCRCCGKSATPENAKTFWHCPQEFNNNHPDGIDICNLCIDKNYTINNKSSNETYKQPQLVDSNCQQNEKCIILQEFVLFMKQYYENSFAMLENIST
eukprot:356439_1